MKKQNLPVAQGLYRPQFEHDACGIGMLVDIKGNKSNALVLDSIDVLHRLTHRGGAGSESNTGDGAGILIQIPYKLFSEVASTQGVLLPQEGDYAVAMVFVSPEPHKGEESLKRFCQIAQRYSLNSLWNRPVPVNPNTIGKGAAEVAPAIYQIFLQRPLDMSSEDFERQLYLVAGVATAEIRHCEKGADPYFYLSSCSSKTIVYKGMLLPEQLPTFYLDLQDNRVESAISLVHSRFSTNTFPSWERAHPQRILIHNGEINTIHSNTNWVKTRQKRMKSSLFQEDISTLFPVLDEDGSDSAILDDYIRLLLNCGYSLPHAMAMAVPEPYENNQEMPEELKDFYEYHNCLSEPWDGPAALAFSDGVVCGALLDRNGLRPARYAINKKGWLVLASETGVLRLDKEDIVQRGRLQPGQMLLVDTKLGKVLENSDLKQMLANEKPYGKWLSEGLSRLEEEPVGNEIHTLTSLRHEIKSKGDAGVLQRQRLRTFGNALYADGVDSALSEVQREKMYGYSWEDISLTVLGMAQTGDDPVGSMGIDTPLAVLSGKPQLLYNYFKQQFAQVTNPPIDALREKIVTSSSVLLGSEGNLLEPTAENCKMIKHDTPILSSEELERIQKLQGERLRSITIPMLFDPKEGALETALDSLFEAARIAIRNGYNLIVLSDKGAGENYAPIPALLAVSGLHQYLIRAGLRTCVSLVAEAGDAWETHHLAALVSFGADAVCPHMAYKAIDELVRKQMLTGDAQEAKHKYLYAATKSIVKIMSKMGISTVRSYRGSQMFEALGISQAVISRYFTGTTTRIEGLGMQEMEQEILERYRAAVTHPPASALEAGGNYKWRKNCEYHLFNPENVITLQMACRTGNYQLFQEYSKAVNKRSEQVKNIRGLLDMRLANKPIPLDQVESAHSIVKRFKTGAMSYGSISQEAHECMAIAMNRLGAKSNTGEGGEDPSRFEIGPDGENRCSAIKQVASGRFGVTINYLSHAKEIQIKMAQGAKPGEGGHLPGKKVYPWIAKNRYSTPGVELISPPPHHDIYSIEDLAQLIHDLKSANPEARISVKLVSEAGVGTVAVGVAKGLADVVVISGYDGGTGAAPRTSIRHAGLPWELGVAEAHQTLLLNGLRSRITLETDGKLLTGRDVIIAALLGAEEFAFATTPLVAMGCDMMRVCNLDTCPVGIATQNPELRKKFSAKPEYVENLMLFLAEEVREWMAALGVRQFVDLIGHTEFLRQSPTQFSAKAKTVDLASLLYQPDSGNHERSFLYPQEHHLEKDLDESVLYSLCKPALEEGLPVRYSLPISNENRTVGCYLSGQLTRRYGGEGLPDDTISLDFYGSGGQSFGAFITKGMTFRLVGDTNDYLGKGLCGGKLILSSDTPSNQYLIAGNVAFFGATSGEGYLNGMAGERFCVRNSGASVVVEGIGEHGCEYMTGGRVLVLGSVGQNFGAGMSGGVAYLYDPQGTVKSRCNLEKANLYALEESDKQAILEMVSNHYRYTNSPCGKKHLDQFVAEHFVKLVPNEYKAILDQQKEQYNQGEVPDGARHFA